MSIYLDDFKNFDYEDARWYAEEGSDILFFGRSDDGVCWTVCPGYDKAFRVVMCKPGYGFDEIKLDPYGPAYAFPVRVDEFDDLYDVALHVDYYGSIDW